MPSDWESLPGICSLSHRGECGLGVIQAGAGPRATVPQVPPLDKPKCGQALPGRTFGAAVPTWFGGRRYPTGLMDRCSQVAPGVMVTPHRQKTRKVKALKP